MDTHYKILYICSSVESLCFLIKEPNIHTCREKYTDLPPTENTEYVNTLNSMTDLSKRPTAM